MKPAWDKLMKKYKGSTTALVADVDCTAEGKPLCETHGVEGFPTIKWGDPSALEDYDGERELEDLEKFANENLKPLCSPNNIDLCDEERKNQIKELQEMSEGDLKSKIEDLEGQIKSTTEDFDKAVEGLQAQYEEMEKTKKDTIDKIKNSGLGLMKAVRAAKAPKEEL